MKLNSLVLFIVLSTINIFGQKVVDEIAAIVDNEIILKSELDYQTNFMATQRKIDPNTQGLRESVLNAMIEEKLVYAQANLDSIIINEEEVESRLDYQVEVLKQQYGSIDRIEQVYGMSIEKIKRESRDEVRKQMMTQRLQEKNFAGVEATRREIEEFYATYQDSLGIIPEKVTLSHIFRNPKSTDQVKEKYRQEAQGILDSIKAGADFAELAKALSQDPASAVQGGDLGFVKKGVFYPEFESAAYALKINEVSEVIESPVGYHIIQLLDKRGESIHTRHILIKIKNDEQADLRAIEFLTDIRDSIVRGGKDFDAMAMKYSEDKETAVFGGELGSFYQNQLDKNLTEAVSKLKEGEISFPKRIEFGGDNYGYHIVYLEKRVPQHKADLSTDYTEIKRLADEYKKQNEYKKFIEELKKKIYYEIKI